MNAIADLYQQFNPMRPLTAADQADRALYVDWQRQLGGDDIKSRLAHGIAWSSSGQAVIHLFTGPRGVGKTTELYRVKHLLEEGQPGKRFFVSMLLAEEWLNLDDVQPEELSFQIVRQLVTDLRRAGYNANGTVREFFRKLGLEFNKKLGLDTIEIGPDPLKFTFKSQDVPLSRRREFRELLQGQLPRIYDLVNNQLITEARKWLKERGVDGILIIVDEIDRIPELGSNHERLFIGRAGMLRALDCHVLYTIPIELAYSSRQSHLRDIYGTETLTLPVMPVLDPAGNMHTGAQNALREIVKLRAGAASLEIQAIFEEEEQLTETLCASGGHVRTLFVLLRSMLDRVERLPVTRPIVQRTLRGTAADLALPLSRSDWSILEQVHSTKNPVNGGDSDAWNRLLRDSYVFTYYQEDMGYWYDRNPLLNYTEAPG